MSRFKKFIFVFLLCSTLLFFWIKAQKMYTTSQFLSKNPMSAPQREMAAKSDPVFDRDNPQAKGVILSFKRWPNQEETATILKKLTEKGLKKKSELPRFKVWIFEWPEWRKGLEAERVCEAISELLFLDYCEPDYLLGPANIKLPQLQEESLSPVSVQKGNLKTCGIVSGKFGLRGWPERGADLRFGREVTEEEAELSDYWAQEMIGADLLKEEVNKVSPPSKKHFVAVFDDSSERYGRHDIGVKNLISDEGKHSVLPEIGGKASIHDVRRPSAYLEQSSRLLDKVQEQCREKYRWDNSGGR